METVTQEVDPARKVAGHVMSTDWGPSLARLGISAFRPAQLEVIETVVRGEDCICVMPTGGGKSLCYQLPAISRPGVCLVVSPLIALMKDQVDQLQQRGVRAELINSTLGQDEQGQRLDALRAGQIDLLYVAPERFRSPRFRDVLRDCHIQLLAVDEAHCISEWGHDFRHDYSRLGEYRQWLGNPTTIALTATATEEVRHDIAKQLGLVAPRTFVAGFARPNLHYEVRPVASQSEKILVIQAFLQENPGAGIIYAASRRACEELAAALVGENRLDERRVAVYHGGLPLERRREVQNDFMTGKAEIMIATNAFGMGINKSNVRFVIHYQIPGTLESYYQEAGRAGRDGEVARCLLLLNDADRYIQEFFIESTHPAASVIREVYEFLRGHVDDPVELTQQEIQQALQLSLSPEGVGTCERILEKQGVLERLEPRRNQASVRLDSDLPTLLDLLPRKARVQRQVLRALEEMVGSRRFERVYFGLDDLSRRCKIDLVTLQRALRELRQLSVFDFVPPFRGRAVHLLRRDVPFASLKLDLQGLEMRRRLSLEKLDSTFRYARSQRCRQNLILQHFGEAASAPCGHCDNCEARGPGQVVVTDLPEVSEALGQAALMVLSGVARCRNAFGKSTIAGMLCGSQSKKIQQWGLDQLSTFGLLRPLRQSEVVLLIDELIEQQLLESIDVDRHRPVLKLTPRGDQVMRGRAAWVPDVMLPPTLLRKLMQCLAARSSRTAENPGSGPASEPASPAPAALKSLAASSLAASSLAASSLSTSSLAELPLAAAAPSRDARVPLGEGPDRSADSASLPLDSASLPLDSACLPLEDVSPAARPSHYWTWRALRDGYSRQECAALRQLTEAEVWADALQAVHAGWPVRTAWMLSAPEQLALQEFLTQTDADQHSDPTHGTAAPAITREQVEWFVLTRESDPEPE